VPVPAAPKYAYQGEVANRNFRAPTGAPRHNPRRRALAQWRGLDLAPYEQERTVRAKSLRLLMPSVLSSLRIDSRRAEAEVVKVWNTLLDPNIVAHAQPTGLRKGTLFVAVDNHTWLCEIVRYRHEEILKQLQYSFGRDRIVKISFRIG